MSDPAPVLCVAVVVRQPGTGRVLLLRRHRADGTYDPWDLTWQNAGGRVEWGESPAECARRELMEETGLDATSFELLSVTSHVAGAKHLVGIVYEAVSYTGEPENREPDRHDAIGWFGLDELPGPMMSGAAEVLAKLAMGGRR